MKSHLYFERGKYLAHIHQWIISANKTQTHAQGDLSKMYLNHQQKKLLIVPTAWLLEGADKGYFEY